MRIAIHDYAGHPFQLELSRELARRGHEVWHLYFAGDSGPKGDMDRNQGDCPRVCIVPIAIGSKYSKTNLLQRRWGDTVYGRKVASWIRSCRPDVVLSGNTPLDAQAAIIDATRVVGGAFVFWMQDSYAKAIELLLGRRWFGLGGLVAAWYRRAEKAQLARSNAVVLVSGDFADRVGTCGGPVVVIPNWGPIGDITVRDKSNDWAARHGLESRFVFLYSGTLALKHDPDSLSALSDAFLPIDDVRVVVVGAGVGWDRLAEAQKARPRSNLILLPLQTFEDLPDVLGSADVLLAVLEEDAAAFSVPSKVLSYLCAGRPVILAAPQANLAARTVLRAGAGIVTPSDHPARLIEEARGLKADQARREAMGRAGRAYAEAHFDIGGVTDQFESLFNRIVS